MSESKHTPGPWRVKGRYVMAMKEKRVAECPCGGVQHGKVDEANARLIAAAPDLLNIVEKALEDCPGDACCIAWHSEARIIVAKAKGETQ